MLAGKSRVRSHKGSPACRDVSLDRFGHLSPDGVGLNVPNYVNQAQLIKNNSSSSSSSSSNAVKQHSSYTAANSITTQNCYIQVQPVPKWRTLVTLAAGMLTVPSSSQGGEESCQLVAQPGKGTLRLLQNTKEPKVLALAWLPSAVAGDSSSCTAASSEPFMMFSQPSSKGTKGLPSPPSSATPTTKTNDPSPRFIQPPQDKKDQPILYEGCELWEDHFTFSQLTLLTGPRQDALSMITQPNGSQVVLLTANTTPSLSFSSSRSKTGRKSSKISALKKEKEETDNGDPTSPHTRRQKVIAGWWLQEQWQPTHCLAPPVIKSLLLPRITSSVVASHPASLLNFLLESPPLEVDITQMRRDMKNGNLKVTVQSYGPLPSSLVTAMMSTRAAVLKTAGRENHDTCSPEIVATNGEEGGGKKKESDEDASTKTSSTIASNALAVPPLPLLDKKRLQQAYWREFKERRNNGRPLTASSSIPLSPSSSPSSGESTPYGTPIHIIPIPNTHKARDDDFGSGTGSGSRFKREADVRVRGGNGDEDREEEEDGVSSSLCREKRAAEVQEGGGNNGDGSTMFEMD